jgi:hypothetical protein
MVVNFETMVVNGVSGGVGATPPVTGSWHDIDDSMGDSAAPQAPGDQPDGS